VLGDRKIVRYLLYDVVPLAGSSVIAGLELGLKAVFARPEVTSRQNALLSPLTAKRLAAASSTAQQNEIVVFAAAVVNNGIITRHSGFDHAGKQIWRISSVGTASSDSG
jgi:hypothetical protein